ncbi:hypothetical protein [Fervidobacterium sp.]
MHGGFENDDDKLKNVMKLKQELEKDLKKKGLLKDNKQEKTKSSTVDEETMKRLKESVVTTAHIVDEKSLTLYDINFQDYDANMEDLIKTLKAFVTKTTNLNHKLIFDGLIKMLEGNVKKANELFKQASGIEAKYNALLTSLYNGEDPSQDIIMFLKNNSESIYPLLLLLERELLKGTCDGVEKIVPLLSKKSPFWVLINDLFFEKASEETLSVAVREKGFAALVMLLSVYIDSTKDYPIQNHTCLNVHKAYLRGETITAPEWCIYGQLAIEARKYLTGYKVDLGKLKRFDKTPEGSLFLGMLYFNENNNALAKQYIQTFEKQVGKYKLYAKPLKQSKIGMEQFLHMPTDYQPVAQDTSIMDFLSLNPGYDIYVKYRNVEFIRLVFSEEHCKINYSSK